MSAPSFRDTKWGQACIAIWEEMAKRWPNLQLAVGPDESASHASAPVISFDHAGGETVQSAIRGGAGAVARHPYDRLPAIGFEVWGSDPVESEELFEGMLLALDAVAHGRAGKPGAVKPEIGSLTGGQLGTKYTGTFLVRIAVQAPTLRAAKPTSIGITANVTAPDGTGGEEAQIV